MMRRRQSLTLVALSLAFGAAACAGSPSEPSFRISTEQLERTLAQRFPRRFPVAGLFELSVETPRLQMLPELNRIASRMVVQAAGPALRRSYSGAFALDFGLRYEPADRSIRAHHLRVESLSLGGLPAQSAALLEAYAKVLADQAMLEVVLHRLKPDELALPESMGLQPGAITVTPGGLVIGFVRKSGS